MPKIRQLPPGIKKEDVKEYLINANPHMDIKFDGDTAYVRLRGSKEPYVQSHIPGLQNEKTNSVAGMKQLSLISKLRHYANASAFASIFSTWGYIESKSVIGSGLLPLPISIV